MKSLKFPLLLLIIASSLHAALPTYNAYIVAIFGSGNPDTGWTAATSDNHVVVALRAKNRETASTANVNGVYSMPVGLQAPNNNRARWNWEFSINSGPYPLTSCDYYLEIDLDPSTYADSITVNALTTWADNSYGNNSTLNGQGVEGPASTYASTSYVAQQSQNILFYPGSDATIDATYTYTLYAVAAGAGPNGVRLVSVSIDVVVGDGGPIPPDADDDGVPDSIDVCDNTPSGATVNSQGCSIQEELDLCKLNVANHGEYMSCLTQKLNAMVQTGLITQQQRSAYLREAAKSDIGK